MTTKLIKTLIRDKVNKHEIFEKAVARGWKKKKAAGYLAQFPDYDLADKYNKQNIVLISIYSLLVFINILGIINNTPQFNFVVTAGVVGLFILIYGWVVCSIYRKQAFGYLFMSFLLFKSIFDSFIVEINQTTVWIDSAISLAILLYAVTLKNKLFPHQNFINTKRNDEGLLAYTKSSVDY